MLGRGIILDPKSVPPTTESNHLDKGSFFTPGITGGFFYLFSCGLAAFGQCFETVFELFPVRIEYFKDGV